VFGIALGGALAVSAAVVVAWYSVSSGRRTAPAVASNLRSGAGGGSASVGPGGAGGGVVDLHAALLEHSAHDRLLLPGLERLAAKLRRVTPAGMFESMERRILLAGASTSWTVERVLATKIVAACAGLVVGWLLRSSFGWSGLLGLVAGFGPAVVGFFGPEILLGGRADRRQTAIGIELADTIDQITVSVSAGLGLEAALARVSRTGTGPLAEELTRTLQDTRAGMSRSAAMKALVERTSVAELRTVITALLQAEGYGVPVSHVLRVQAADLRLKRRQQAEERAMKLPVKVLFPLVTCILPTVFIILLGPAGIRIARMFSQMH